MIFKQFYLPCLAHASYLIGDETTGTAVVVDPQRDTGQYIAPPPRLAKSQLPHAGASGRYTAKMKGMHS